MVRIPDTLQAIGILSVKSSAAIIQSKMGNLSRVTGEGLLFLITWYENQIFLKILPSNM